MGGLQPRELGLWVQQRLRGLRVLATADDCFRPVLTGKSVLTAGQRPTVIARLKTVARTSSDAENNAAE